MKFTKSQLETIFAQARAAALTAGQAQLAKLQAQGPAFSIHNADVITGKPTGPSQGTMLDLCGFAYCLIPRRGLSKRLKAVKELIADGTLSDWSYQGALNVRLNTASQYISVREAEAEAAVAVLKQHGITAYVDSRLD